LFVIENLCKFVANLKGDIMADNYLEDKFERYRARKAAWEKLGKPAKSKSHTITKAAPNKRDNETDIQDNEEQR
jgi:hypothetical protein